MQEITGWGGDWGARGVCRWVFICVAVVTGLDRTTRSLAFHRDVKVGGGEGGAKIKKRERERERRENDKERRGRYREGGKIGVLRVRRDIGRE